MIVNSPLGKYSQVVASIVALAVIGAYVVAVLLDIPAAANLQPIALLAVGAVFGSAAAVNGYKRDQVAIQKRLDAAGVPAAPAIDPAPADA